MSPRLQRLHPRMAGHGRTQEAQISPFVCTPEALVSVLFILIPIAVWFVLGAILGFVWASRTGQLDDLQTPAVRVLFDD
jgi:cbb3-type cytochrome oxidase maturation protein